MLAWSVLLWNDFFPRADEVLEITSGAKETTLGSWWHLTCGECMATRHKPYRASLSPHRSYMSRTPYPSLVFLKIIKTCSVWNTWPLSLADPSRWQALWKSLSHYPNVLIGSYPTQLHLIPSPSSMKLLKRNYPCNFLIKVIEDEKIFTQYFGARILWSASVWHANSEVVLNCIIREKNLPS